MKASSVGIFKLIYPQTSIFCSSLRTTYNCTLRAKGVALIGKNIHLRFKVDAIYNFIRNLNSVYLREKLILWGVDIQFSSTFNFSY